MPAQNVTGRRIGGAFIDQVDGASATLVYLLDLLAGLALLGLLPGLTGWTPGKLITGLRVVRADRERAGMGRSLARPFLWIADGFP